MQEELTRELGPGRAPSLGDRVRLPYTDAVLHEAQRLLALVPMGIPRALTRTTCFRGYTLPQGTEVFPLLGSVLHDPEVFEQPEEFNPDRFLDADGRFKKQEAFLPFSLGICWACPCAPTGWGIKRAGPASSSSSPQVSASASGRAWLELSCSSSSPPSCRPSPWRAHAHRVPWASAQLSVAFSTSPQPSSCDFGPADLHPAPLCGPNEGGGVGRWQPRPESQSH